MRRTLILGALALASTALAQRLSPLAPAPDWTDLDPYQETITREDFTRLLDSLYAPLQAAAGLIDIAGDTATIRKNLVPGDTYTLRFAKSHAQAKAPRDTGAHSPSAATPRVPPTPIPPIPLRE